MKDQHSESMSATETASALSIASGDAPRPASPHLPTPSAPNSQQPSELEYQDQPSSMIPNTATDATVAQTSASEAQHTMEPIHGEKRPLEPIHYRECMSKCHATLVIKSALYIFFLSCSSLAMTSRSQPQRGATMCLRMDTSTTANKDNAGESFFLFSFTIFFERFYLQVPSSNKLNQVHVCLYHGNFVDIIHNVGDKDPIQELMAMNNATSADMPVPSASDSSASLTTVAATKAL